MGRLEIARKIVPIEVTRNMCVHIHHARQQVPVRKVNYSGIGRDIAEFLADLDNSLTVDLDDCILGHLAISRAD